MYASNIMKHMPYFCAASRDLDTQKSWVQGTSDGEDNTPEAQAVYYTGLSRWGAGSE